MEPVISESQLAHGPQRGTATTAGTPSTRELAVRLSWVIAAGMSVQAAGGLLFPGVYRDVAWIRTAWFGCDVVTLLLAVPLLAGGLLTAARGSRRGELLWYAALSYGLYNYAYLMLGAHLNTLFPLYVGLFVASVWTLILALSTADLTDLVAGFDARTRTRAVAIYMMLTGLGLGVAWLSQWGAYAFGGAVPSIGEGPFKLVASLDLSIIVPSMIVGAVLLWRRRRWGYLLAAILNTKGAAYTAGLTVASVVGGLRNVPGTMEQAPIWGAWTVVGTTATLTLLWRLRPRAAE